MKRNILLIGIILFVGILGYTVLLLSDSPKVKTIKPALSDSIILFSQLDGSSVVSSSLVTPPVVAVMIDNYPGARPQFGVSSAVIIYEVPVEGDYTRLMAMFPRDGVVAKVGPVRSARSYYLDWQAEYGMPLYLHCGGSPEALSRIKKENIFSANEFYWGGYYWRDNNFVAPHNLFTNSVNWQKLWQDYDKLGERSWSGWSFGDKISTSTSAGAFVIDYGMGYKVEWRFDSAISKYVRYLNNAKQFDASGEDILLDNVVVQYVKSKTIDDYGRKEIESVGTGSVRVFRDGLIISGSWKKNSMNERTRFYDEAGEEIQLKSGKTWVQIVPNESSINITS